jgi:hypothetical protein
MAQSGKTTADLFARMGRTSNSGLRCPERIEIAKVAEPGAVFGELSALLRVLRAGPFRFRTIQARPIDRWACPVAG